MKVQKTSQIQRLGQHIKVWADEEFGKLFPPQADEVKDKVRIKMELEGCAESFPVYWEETWKRWVMLDGYTRRPICLRNGIPFEYRVIKHVTTRQEAISWIITNQLAKRNLTKEEASILRGKYASDNKMPPSLHGVQSLHPSKDEAAQGVMKRKVSDIAEELGVSERTLQYDMAKARTVEEEQDKSKTVNEILDKIEKEKKGAKKKPKISVKKLAKQVVGFLDLQEQCDRARTNRLIDEVRDEKKKLRRMLAEILKPKQEAGLYD